MSLLRHPYKTLDGSVLLNNPSPSTWYIYIVQGSIFQADSLVEGVDNLHQFAKTWLQNSGQIKNLDNKDLDFEVLKVGYTKLL